MGFKERFAAIPWRFIDNVKDASAVVVYVTAQRYADPMTGVFNLTVAALAGRCDLGIDTTKRALKTLADSGWAALEGPPGGQRWRIIPPLNETIGVGSKTPPPPGGADQLGLLASGPQALAMPMAITNPKAQDEDPEDQKDLIATDEERIKAGQYDDPRNRSGIQTAIARVLRAAWIRDVVVGWAGAEPPEVGEAADINVLVQHLKAGATPSGVLNAWKAVPKHAWLAKTKDEGSPCYGLRALLQTRGGLLYEELRGIAKRLVVEDKAAIEARADIEFDEEVTAILPAFQSASTIDADDDPRNGKWVHGHSYRIRGLAPMPMIPIPVPNDDADSEVKTRCALLSTVQRALAAARSAKGTLELRYWPGVVDPVFRLRESILIERRQEHTAALIERDNTLRGRQAEVRP